MHLGHGDNDIVKKKRNGNFFVNQSVIGYRWCINVEIDPLFFSCQVSNTVMKQKIIS